MTTRTRNRLSLSHLGLVAVGFVLAVIVANALFGGVRIDLTENGLYTLSDGTKRIVGDVDEPINLYFYFSDQATAGIPTLRDYAGRVRELLEEIVAESGGDIRLQVIDPLPFSEDEDRAAQFGLTGVPLAITPDPVYLGLAGTNSVGDEEVIEFFQPDRETFLEYDIARLISTLAQPARPKVGLVSGIAMSGSFNPQTQRMDPAWVVYEQAQQLFAIDDLGTNFDVVPDDIDLLWIVQPKDLSAGTQYAIDQFVMRGGRALIFVDPLAAIDVAADPSMPQEMAQRMPPTGQGSNLALLFSGWGIVFDAEQVVADAQLALPINTGLSPRPVRHYGYLGLGTDQLDAGDVTTAELGTINFAMPGAIAVADDGTATLQPLLQSTAASTTLPASRFNFLPDPASLQDGFEPGGEALTLAARIGGMLQSAFPDGGPGGDDADASVGDDLDADPAIDASGGDNESPRTHLAESNGPVNLIVVADVDMLSDSMWVRVERFFGQQIASAFAGNGAFAVNALESLAGNPDLISVRSRGSASRPFTRVDALRVQAESRFRETEQRLQQQLDETERRLGELQSTREDSGSLLLSDEQQAEIDRFIDQRASIRKELRSVQRGLDRDIEDLGTRLKLINIGLVPLLITVFALVAAWRRRREGR